MAISNYSELKAAIADWLNRSDLTDSIPDFIALAETRHKRDFKIRRMETRVISTIRYGKLIKQKNRYDVS